jgi:hypothetical protein
MSKWTVETALNFQFYHMHPLVTINIYGSEE